MRTFESPITPQKAERINILYKSLDYLIIPISLRTKYIQYESSTTNGRGHYIIVEATNDNNNVHLSSQKLRYVYMHMKESPTTTNSAVVENAYVGINTLIGKVGTTGSSTGNHLHLGIIIDGGLSTSITHVINPMMFYPNIDFTY